MSTSSSTTTRAPPRTGPAQKVLDWALESPLWKYLLVPQARKTMVQTAEANDIPWRTAKAWIQREMMETQPSSPPQLPPEEEEPSSSIVPVYYQRAFHAYDDGNLSWEAAYEVEIASCAVGARNFPQFGSNGEYAFRDAFDSALVEARGDAVILPKGATMVDLGCGTGMSTRRLARNYPQAASIVGVDLSPYFIAVGRRLLELEPKSFQEGGPWVSTIERDDRIQYVVGDAATASTLSQLQSTIGTVDVVNIQFVLHELPPQAARDVVDEAFRLLKPRGQLWICEMDFEAPAYAAQRANPLLFSLIRSTEPYLDDYAESIASLFDYVQSQSKHVKVIPATGRHYALVATKAEESSDDGNNKNVMEDLRFDANGNYRVEDTHLKVWESKQEL